MAKEKKPCIEVAGEEYLRLPIKTHLIEYGEDLKEVVLNYAKDLIEDEDILFITEKIVAITQGRAYPVNDIKPRKLAIYLSSKVTKTKAGIGLGIPETMEMALRECGVPRIIFASAISAFGKILGRKGDFYRVAGYKASSIDGPTSNTIAPYNKYVVLGPANPDKVAEELGKSLSCKVAIVDINDFGGNTLGISHKNMDRDKIAKILSDNPLGQCSESTPIGIIRKK